MAIDFTSSAWSDQLLAAARASDALREAGVTWIMGPVLLVIDAAAADGLSERVALRIDMHAGEVRDVRWVDDIDAAGARTPFVIAGSYQRMRTLLSGELDVVDALLASSLRITGDLPAIARHRALFTALSAAAASIDTAWPEAAAEPATA